MMNTRETLLQILEDGKHTVYTKLNHVSRSGMSRSISLYVITGPAEVLWITGMVASLYGLSLDRYDGLTVRGCGMDMGFDIVYSLSVHLYCPKKYDHGAAYKLQHRWL